MNIKDAIQKLAATGDELYCKICVVDAVDEAARTIDCTPINEDDAPVLGVNLQANQDGTVGVAAFPAVGSYVVVAFLGKSAGVVVLTEEITKISLGIGETTAEIIDRQIDMQVGETTIKISPDGVVINGGDNYGMVKIKELTDKLNAFIDAFNSHTHTIQAGNVNVVGSQTAQSNPAPVVVPAIDLRHDKFSQVDYENEQVKH